MSLPVPKPPVHAVDPGFLVWLRHQRCWACQRAGRVQTSITEAAHLDSRRYGDAENAIPLCGHEHHREGRYALHKLGRPGFQHRWRTNLPALGRTYYRQYIGERNAF